MVTNGCQATTVRKIVSFDSFHNIIEDELIIGNECQHPAEYSVHAYGADKLTCADHLPLLVDEATGYWEGNMVPVRRLSGAK